MLCQNSSTEKKLFLLSYFAFDTMSNASVSVRGKLYGRALVATVLGENPKSEMLVWSDCEEIPKMVSNILLHMIANMPVKDEHYKDGMKIDITQKFCPIDWLTKPLEGEIEMSIVNGEIIPEVFAWNSKVMSMQEIDSSQSKKDYLTVIKLDEAKRKFIKNRKDINDKKFIKTVGFMMCDVWNLFDHKFDKEEWKRRFEYDVSMDNWIGTSE